MSCFGATLPTTLGSQPNLSRHARYRSPFETVERRRNGPCSLDCRPSTPPGSTRRCASKVRRCSWWSKYAMARHKTVPPPPKDQAARTHAQTGMLCPVLSCTAASPCSLPLRRRPWPYQADRAGVMLRVCGALFACSRTEREPKKRLCLVCLCARARRAGGPCGASISDFGVGFF